MAFGKKDQPEEPPVDNTGWILDHPFADFLLMHTAEIKFMCMLGYTFFHGNKVFSAMSPTAAPSYKFVSFIMACTGGGILVPIFLNGVPVPLANDALAIAMILSYAIHQYFPVVRDILSGSKILLVLFIVFFEIFRAGVAVTLISLAEAKISPSVFSFPLFGPIFCGGIAGCGGAFLPLNKGLDPIKQGMAAPMFSALTGAAAFHLFLNSPLSEGCVDAKKKAHVCLAVYFILVGLVKGLDLNPFAKAKTVTPAKKES